jgi:hypothetical protein
VENLVLYRLSTVNPVYRDAAYDSCGASSCAPHANQHLPGKHPVKRDFGYPIGSVTKKVVFLVNGTNHSRRMSLIV